MSRDLKRRAYIGFTAGLLSSALLVSTFRSVPLALVLAAAVGTIYALAFRRPKSLPGEPNDRGDIGCAVVDIPERGWRSRDCRCGAAVDSRRDAL